MRIRVQLAGHTLAWRFHGLDSLADYIDSRPWLAKPAIEIVRVADLAESAAVLAAIEEECLLASREGGAVRTHVVPATIVAHRGPVAALLSSLDLHDDMNDLDAATAVGTEAAVTSRLFLFPLLPSDRPQLRSELEQFADLVTKVESLARFAIVCLDTPVSQLGGRCHDLVDGLIPAPTNLLSVAEPAAWRIYLHHRIAWETGGRVAAAVALEEELVSGGLPVGADQGFEDRLAEAATKRFAMLDGVIRSQIDAVVRKSVAREDLVGLFPADLFWSPTETAGLLPRPWVARALLAAMPDHQHSELLRNCLVCVPLGHALLAACAVFETQVRSRVKLPSSPEPDAPCIGPWQLFLTGGGLERELFPPSGPGLPTSPWEFASLGECLAKEVVKDRSGSWRHDIRVIRNHLAHGHHVGWSAVKTLRRLSERVALG